MAEGQITTGRHDEIPNNNRVSAERPPEQQTAHGGLLPLLKVPATGRLMPKLSAQQLHNALDVVRLGKHVEQAQIPYPVARRQQGD